MTYYDQIYELAVDNYYLVSTRDAVEAGIPPIELAKLAHRGKLENISHGLYRLARHVPHPNDAYAVAVAQVGPDAYLFGESVIAMLGLAPTNPAYTCVAAPKRVRKRLPSSIRLKKPTEGDVVTSYEGIPAQSVASAIRSARTTMMDDRLREAAQRAREKGYLFAGEYAELKEEMGWDEEAEQ
ncbi:type IV toxin-antitoxin system AbiEi family antitoxin domain-containing protein [Xiamenia xianingshaonis]|uniref:AbiEi antitoxin N-terminal domain-containing protein n=1 Tax=Xiamenia xianingshaonis TaxID=2682776 RepID=A0ABX0IIB7_9ACTN|nr:type IV toxin-antitoxin system AbiEi family antitoxin domain-containing protein [Xiamenia xianingshaonis]NHM13551.1 hypothetical protein [Xiamenia xianingshaonis]